MRLGQGFDVHAFGPAGESDHLMVGGVRIPHQCGVLAHSDGDVLLHAICDALLGAIAAGDIGHHFPDSDERWKDADSRTLLRECYRLVKAAGFQLANIDSCIIAQAPKMAPYLGGMRKLIAADLEADISQVSVKATTTEELGFIGRKEGLAAQASVLLLSIE
ncbi:MAG: 2-C-methyl-D-erythritol 2,4-cyclodiphosphate synthase [Pseudohongiellaceae bacterium]